MILEKNQAGFFIDFHNKVKNSINQNQLNEFSGLTRGIDRIKYVDNYLSETKIALPCEVSIKGIKNAEIALKAKEDGNKAFQQQNYPRAVTCYSYSILQMPWNEKGKSF